MNCDKRKKYFHFKVPCIFIKLPSHVYVDTIVVFLFSTHWMSNTETNLLNVYSSTYFKEKKTKPSFREKFLGTSCLCRSSDHMPIITTPTKIIYRFIWRKKNWTLDNLKFSKYIFLLPSFYFLSGEESNKTILMVT